MEIVRIDERLIRVKMGSGKSAINFYSVYAMHQGLSASYKETLNKKLSENLYKIPESERVILADLNRQVGR